jgi:hypothetical protein
MYAFISSLDQIHTPENARLATWLPTNAKETLKRDALAGVVTRDSLLIALGILCSFLVPPSAVGEVSLPPDVIVPSFNEPPPVPQLASMSVEDIAAMHPTTEDITPGSSTTAPAPAPQTPGTTPHAVTPTAPGQNLTSGISEPVKFAAGAAVVAVGAVGLVYLIARQLGRAT